MSEISNLKALTEAVDDVFSPHEPDTTLLHRTHEKCVDTFGTLVLLGGAAVYQAAAAATHGTVSAIQQVMTACS